MRAACLIQTPASLQRVLRCQDVRAPFIVCVPNASLRRTRDVRRVTSREAGRRHVAGPAQRTTPANAVNGSDACTPSRLDTATMKPRKLGALPRPIRGTAFTEAIHRDRPAPCHPARHHRRHHRIPADLQHRPSADRREARPGPAFGPLQRRYPGRRHPGGDADLLETHLAAAHAMARSGQSRLSAQADRGVPDHRRAWPDRGEARLQAARDGDADRLGAGDRRLLDDSAPKRWRRASRTAAR